MLMAKIDWSAIGRLLWAAPLAGIAVALTFAVLILGVSRAEDARRDGSGGVSTVYSAAALVAGLAFVGVVVYGISVITTK